MHIANKSNRLGLVDIDPFWNGLGSSAPKHWILSTHFKQIEWFCQMNELFKEIPCIRYVGTFI